MHFLSKQKHHPSGGVFVLAEMEGFDLHFAFGKIIELPPSSRWQATVHRTVAFRSVQIPILLINLTPCWGVRFIGGDGGI